MACGLGTQALTGRWTQPTPLRSRAPPMWVGMTSRDVARVAQGVAAAT